MRAKSINLTEARFAELLQAAQALGKTIVEGDINQLISDVRAERRCAGNSDGPKIGSP